VKVGAATETALKEKKSRIEDAIGGDPCGSGRGCRRRRRGCPTGSTHRYWTAIKTIGDEIIGVNIIRKALELRCA